MTVRLVAVSFDVAEPEIVAAFWASLLGRETVRDEVGLMLPGHDTQVGLRFVEPATDNSNENRLHLHLTSSAPGDQQHTVARALDLGGRHIDVGQGPDEDYVVLADPGGNAFCVIEAGNNFLAGCGFLGEVTCDGSREVGLFWSAALEWPLVWDRDGETAIQSPRGGTKVSWGGPPVAPKNGRNRQRFHLSSSDVANDIERLIRLGATLIGNRDGAVELADTDGNEFALGSADGT